LALKGLMHEKSLRLLVHPQQSKITAILTPEKLPK
jgi:hypothetical protein